VEKDAKRPKLQHVINHDDYLRLCIASAMQSSEITLRRAGREAGGAGAGSSSFFLRAGEDFEVVVSIKDPFGPVTGAHVLPMMQAIDLFTLPGGLVKRTGEPRLCTKTGTACFPVRIERSGDLELSAAVEFNEELKTIGQKTRVRVAPGAMLFASLDVKASEEVSAKKRVKEAAVSAAAAGRSTDYGEACAGCGRVPRMGDVVECEMAEPSAPGGVEWLAGEVIRVDVAKKEMIVRIQDEKEDEITCNEEVYKVPCNDDVCACFVTSCLRAGACCKGIPPVRSKRGQKRARPATDAARSFGLCARSEKERGLAQQLADSSFCAGSSAKKARSGGGPRRRNQPPARWESRCSLCCRAVTRTSLATISECR
jgi:hypothetical protein